MSGIRANPQPGPGSAPSENLVVKPTLSGPKPCCVCKEEKSKRDECMLFSEKGEVGCIDQINAYKKCMAGFGFNI